jgi:hypothetical protein
MENRALGNLDAVVIHLGTNDLRRTTNLDFVMGNVYALMNKSETKFTQFSLVLIGAFRRRDV